MVTTRQLVTLNRRITASYLTATGTPTAAIARTLRVSHDEVERLVRQGRRDAKVQLAVEMKVRYAEGREGTPPDGAV